MKSFKTFLATLTVVLAGVLSTVSTTAEARRDYCRSCGVVREVYRDRGEDKHLGAGTAIGAIAGAALGNQIGKGSGRTAATIAGAVAGGAVGHNVEKRNRDSRTIWRVEVEMDDGSYRTVSMYSNRESLRRGDRVQVRNGQAYLYR
jgi:outer membrane lipoprotein SlyB